MALGKAHAQIAELQSALDEERERSKELKEVSAQAKCEWAYIPFARFDANRDRLSPLRRHYSSLQEIEHVRSSKKAIEQRLGGGGAAFWDNDDEVNRLTTEAEAREKEWAIEKDALEKKIRWYMENQELLEEQEAALAELRSRNQALEDKMKHSRADQGKPLHQESALVSHAGLFFFEWPIFYRYTYFKV